MAVRTRYISLFSGVGGLDLSIRIAMPDACCVCYVEGEAYAASVLAARMEDETLDKAPIYSDVRTFRGESWSGKVDFIVGGFPCQDLSLSGKGAGIHGPRSGLWFEYLRIVREVRPRFIFVENVPGLVRRGLDVVLGSLAEIGFDAEWCCLPAEITGAPHRRDRFFMFAYEVADRYGVRGKGAEARGHAGDPSVCVRGDADLRTSRKSMQDSLVLGRSFFPPGPEDIHAWINTEHHAQPCVYGVDDGMANRVDRVRACGNGVVALQGAAALSILAGRAGVDLGKGV